MSNQIGRSRLQQALQRVGEKLSAMSLEERVALARQYAESDLARALLESGAVYTYCREDDELAQPRFDVLSNGRFAASPTRILVGANESQVAIDNQLAFAA